MPDAVPDAVSPTFVSPPPTPGVTPQLPHTIFRGPNGIRAGWRTLIFLALLFGMAAGVLFVKHLLRHGQPRTAAGVVTPLHVFLNDGLLFLITVIAAFIMARVERRPLAQYGLPVKFAFRKNFWVGAVIGFLSISVTLLCIFALHGFRLTGLAIHGATIAAAFASWSATTIMVGLFEEFAFRGYLQFTLTTGIGFWPSALLLSALFGLAHAANLAENKIGLLAVVCIGPVLCLFLRRTGNLWWAVGFHAGYDWGESFFYGVPDSSIQPYHNLFSSEFHGPSWLTGGNVGPEASVFTPIVLLLLAIIFSHMYPEIRYKPLGDKS